ncbi:Essential recombination function protein [uncultured Caudovirales phage]|uniref:Essential recombination function protein n=1 Tax=uncultured Caudovirales phage TaxID=2100421 RepID=A0A6J5SVZ3_9CAUD|nr:Essential recombination function protein [uncultured Caudovirales phage]
MSENLTIQAALAAVMGDVREVAKKDRNTSQNFNFRGIDAVVNAVGPALRAHGVIVMPEVLEHSYATVTVGRNATSMGHTIIKVRYRFTGPAGDFLDCVVLGEAMDAGDKATPKAMSVAFRTALLQALALPTDEPDPDASTFERSSAPIVAPIKRELTDEIWDTLLGDMTHAVDLETLEGTAKTAATYDLPDDKRNQLRALYLEKKAALA